MNNKELIIGEVIDFLIETIDGKIGEINSENAKHGNSKNTKYLGALEFVKNDILEPRKSFYNLK